MADNAMEEPAFFEQLPEKEETPPVQFPRLKAYFDAKRAGVGASATCQVAMITAEAETEEEKRRGGTGRAAPSPWGRG